MEPGTLSNDELHLSEEWFHGNLSGGRRAAEILLKEHSGLGDNRFLVRENSRIAGFALSFWHCGKAYHCRIKSKVEHGQTKYYLYDTDDFDSLYSIICYYRTQPIRHSEFHLILNQPVPQPNKQ